jgi:hypothetical protein
MNELQLDESLCPPPSCSSGILEVRLRKLIVAVLASRRPFAPGQRDIRSIWPKYYSECHAVCFVIDSTDKERIEECWKVFGALRRGGRPPLGTAAAGANHVPCCLPQKPL